MFKKILHKDNRPFLYLLLIQLVILLLALGSFLVQKPRLMLKGFTVDDYVLTAGELTEDVALIDDLSGHRGSFLTINTPLKAGTYQVTVLYGATADGNSISAHTTDISNLHFHSTAMPLSPRSGYEILSLELDRAAEEVTLDISYGGIGSLEISGITLQETAASLKQNFLYALGLCILLGLGFALWKSSLPKRRTMLMLGGIFIASSIPLFLDYLIAGHDLPFQLLRIEGIAESLRQGIFPVKIDPLWAQDYGYAVSVFYGNALLYIPAVFRLFGFSIQASYQAFVLLINLGTVLIAYYSFRSIFRSENAGLWGSLFYTLSLYRLSDVYVRAAVGEYCAMMFLPLILCGFCLAFRKEEESDLKWLQISGLIALGLTGVIQSHILSCEMIALFVVIACLILIKQVIKLRIFRTLAVGAGLTLVLNLGFLVPFLDFYNKEINIRSDSWGGGAFDLIQGKGMFPTQLFSLFQQTNGGTWDTLSGITTEATYAPGIVLLLGLALYLYLKLTQNSAQSVIGNTAASVDDNPTCKTPVHTYANSKVVMICTGLGCLALWMSSCYFPYDALSGTCDLMASLISPIQFPWRFLSLATVFLVVTLLEVLRLTGVLCNCDSLSVPTDNSQSNKQIASGTHFTSSAAISNGSLLATGLTILLLINISWFYYDFTITGNPYRIYETSELNTMALYSEEYLPAGTDSSQLIPDRMQADGCTMENYSKKGTTITATVTSAEGGYLEFPLNHYKYYTCKDQNTGDILPVDAGYNNMVKVSFPAGYAGDIRVFFQKPWFWSLAEILSGISLIGLAGIWIVSFYKKRGRTTSDDV